MTETWAPGICHSKRRSEISESSSENGSLRGDISSLADAIKGMVEISISETIASALGLELICLTPVYDGGTVLVYSERNHQQPQFT